MTVKFRLGFTVDGETLFGLMAKMLPIEDLSVEELPAIAGHPTPPRLVAHKPKPQKNKRPNPGPNLKKGINGILMTELKDGPKRQVNLMTKVKAAGFSENSTSSRLEELRKFGVIERVGDGTWRIKA